MNMKIFHKNKIRYLYMMFMVLFISVFSGCGRNKTANNPMSNVAGHGKSVASVDENKLSPVKKEVKKLPLVLDGAKEFSGHYYKTFEYWTTWEDAQKFCESVGGHLATAESDKECAVITEVLRNSSGIGYDHWLGAVSDSRGVWKWITGGVIMYSNWRIDDPKSVIESIRDSNKLRVDETGKWRNSSPPDRAMLICEWDSISDAHDTNF